MLKWEGKLSEIWKWLFAQGYNQSHTKNSKQNKPYLKTGYFYH